MVLAGIAAIAVLQALCPTDTGSNEGKPMRVEHNLAFLFPKIFFFLKYKCSRRGGEEQPLRMADVNHCGFLSEMAEVITPTILWRFCVTHQEKNADCCVTISSFLFLSSSSNSRYQDDVVKNEKVQEQIRRMAAAEGSST